MIHCTGVFWAFPNEKSICSVKFYVGKKADGSVGTELWTCARHISHVPSASLKPDENLAPSFHYDNKLQSDQDPDEDDELV